MTTLDLKNIQKLLKDFRFTDLFTQELGWDNLRLPPRKMTVEGTAFTLAPVAEKRGFQVFECLSSGEMPVRAVRTKIDREVTRLAYEHLIVFVDAKRQAQIWRWEQRAEGQPRIAREEELTLARQRGERLSRKLESLVVSLEDEERGGLSVAGVSSRVRSAFNVERVTKRFYEQFKKEHDAFLKQITGIEDAEQKSWYASLMLNRLMFIYFIQAKNFLDGDKNYLRNRLALMQERFREDKSYSFYKTFLLKFFHDGLGKPGRDSELKELVGDVPYLNGGLFDTHLLEAPPPPPSAARKGLSDTDSLLNIEHINPIEIPDQAFERVFKFFDDWDWRLDDRPLRDERQISQDVLGYIFEKYINQKQMGAYYTKEDITEYISKHTIIPFLFDRAQKLCANAFDARDGVWKLLRQQPDRYIYDAIKHGITVEALEKPRRQLDEPIALPQGIAAGLDDVSKRTEWNKTASAECGLPTETWREVVARRQRYEEVHAKLEAGQVTQINDLITLNLDIRQFAQDVLATYEGSDLIVAFYRAIAGRVPEKSNEEFEQGLSVLDPTCGSGAFLFAALNVLQPLVETCIARMRSFVEEADRQGRTAAHLAFRRVLAETDKHLNDEYSILKSIIVGNLYGVDIMQEATEICKLRLFLKLVAHVERDDRKPNMGLEPLPDIDFNIKSGNTLVGFVDERSVDRAFDGEGQGKFDYDNGKARFKEEADITRRIFEQFRLQQVKYGGTVTAEDKAALRDRLKQQADELDVYLAHEYGIDTNSRLLFEAWRKSHQPFHWFTEFYGIITSGGFDVIIGNPPYIEYAKVKNDYQVLESKYKTLSSGNLYAFVIERCTNISDSKSRMGMIVQLSAICTDRMNPLQQLYKSSSKFIWASCYDDRPAKLFDGLEHIRATIILNERGMGTIAELFTTRLLRWYTDFREKLFPVLNYELISELSINGSYPKVGGMFLKDLIEKVRMTTTTVAGVYRERSEEKVYYYRSPLYWIRSMDFLPHFNSSEASRSVHHFKNFGLANHQHAPIVGCIINSTLFYLWFIVYGNGRNVALRDIQTFPAPKSIFSADNNAFAKLFKMLMDDYEDNSVIRKRRDGVEYQEFYPSKSKPIIDEIDRVLAAHYGFTDEELDFIINYDIKYRMGSAELESEE